MPWKKGQSGNPGGRAKRTQDEFDLIAAARQKAPSALATIADLMDGSEHDRVRLAAAIAILDRAYGSVTAQQPGRDDPLPSSVTVKRTDASVPEA